MKDGVVFEKGAVNTSLVSSLLSEEAALRMNLAPQKIFATGISLILHPQNPFVPTVHANFRCLELENGDWWFGGGADLTPHYLFDEDARHFHGVWKRVCDNHDTAYYPKFKAWCDRYFYLPHRGETRGIGGIFFDNLSGTYDRLFSFVKECGSAFCDAYIPLAEKRAASAFTEKHKLWQLQRRSRYAEFNLVYDRGTRFGLDTGGRIESILVSMPPLARWDYAVAVDEGSEESRLIQMLKSPQSWTD
jgi:coproporphyrinogen III oxidase